MTNEIGQQVLAVTMGPNDADATTIRGYLAALAGAVWGEKECFSGKRPFGNSGWDHDLYAALVSAELISGVFDEDGYLEEVDSDKGDKLIVAAIKALAEQGGEVSR